MDIVKRAEEWGTKLITPEELMAELKKCKPLPSSSGSKRQRVPITTKVWRQLWPSNSVVLIRGVASIHPLSFSEIP